MPKIINRKRPIVAPDNATLPSIGKNGILIVDMYSPYLVIKCYINSKYNGELICDARIRVNSTTEISLKIIHDNSKLAVKPLEGIENHFDVLIDINSNGRTHDENNKFSKELRSSPAIQKIVGDVMCQVCKIKNINPNTLLAMIY